MLVGCNCGPVLYHVKHDRSEATFYRACFNERWDGYAQNVHKCSHPEEIMWSVFPIAVYSDSEVHETTLKAISIWSEWMNTQYLFYSTDHAEYADVVVTSGGYSPWYLGMARPGRKNGRLHFKVELFNSATDSVETCVHELGHVLGLAHDPEQPRSIMFPNNARWFPVLTETDRQALASRYNL